MTTRKDYRTLYRKIYTKQRNRIDEIGRLLLETLKERDEELARYKNAEIMYKNKFQQKYTAQEMVEMERRHHEDSDS
jgi:hypothetical protein